MTNQHIYLDFQATTPVDPKVASAMKPYFTDKFFNPASLNQYGNEIDSTIENCRLTIAEAINCLPSEVLFTGGATEAINIAIKGLFDFNNKGSIVTVKTEHSAVLNTCRYLEKKGISVIYLDVERDGLINLEKLKAAITADTRLVAVMHVNNEIGVVQPIEEIGRICSEKNVPLFVDAAQSFGKLHIDVHRSNISMLSISGHKIYGPKGVGALYINKKVKSIIAPLIHGGGQEEGLRSGTLNVPGIVGLAKATELAIADMAVEQSRILSYRNLFLKLIQASVSGIIVNGNMQSRVAGNLNVSFKNISGDVLINRLGNILVSRGSACNSLKNQGSHVLKAMGISDDIAESAIRISFGRFTTGAEVLQAVEKISFVVNDIRKTSVIA